MSLPIVRQLGRRCYGSVSNADNLGARGDVAGRQAAEIPGVPIVQDDTVGRDDAVPTAVWSGRDRRDWPREGRVSRRTVGRGVEVEDLPLSRR